MDWSRAKTSLIIIFLALNIFLLVYIGINKSTGHVSNRTLENAVNILKSRGVELAEGTKIPSHGEKLPQFQFGNPVFDRPQIMKTLFGHEGLDESDILDESTYTGPAGDREVTFYADGRLVYRDRNPKTGINADDKKFVEKYLRSFVEELGVSTSSFGQDESFVYGSEGRIEMSFVDIYRGYPVFDNNFHAVVSRKGIMELECRYREIKGFAGTSSDLLPAYIILLKNIYGRDGTVVINDMVLGFKGYKIPSEEEDNAYSEYQSPVWRVTFAEGRPRYFKAYDGEEID